MDEVSLAPGAPARVKLSVRVNRGDRATFAMHDRAGAAFAAYNLRRSARAPGASRRGRPALNHHLGSQMRGVDGDRYELIVSQFSEDGPRVGSRDLEDSYPRRITVLRIRRDGDGNPLRFPRHPHALNRAGVLPMSIAPLVLFAVMAAARPRNDRPDRPRRETRARPSRQSGPRRPSRSRRSGVEHCRPCKNAMKAATPASASVHRRSGRRSAARPHDAAVAGPARRPGSAVAVVLEDLADADRADVATRPELAREDVVALGEPAPVSFWTALERLGLWGDLLSEPRRRQVPEARPPRRHRAGSSPRPRARSGSR